MLGLGLGLSLDPFINIQYKDIDMTNQPTSIELYINNKNQNQTPKPKKSISLFFFFFVKQATAYGAALDLLDLESTYIGAIFPVPG